MPRFSKIIYCTVVALFAMWHQHCSAQENPYPPYDPDVPEMADIQRVIDASMDDIEDSLKIRNDFQPFATVILQNDSIADIHVAQKNGEVFSIAAFEDQLSINALNGTYKVVCIFYLDASNDPAATGNSKIVKIHAEHTNDDFAYRFEFPFTRNARRQIVFGETAVDFEPQIMFKP
jgi:hypothetical protein